MKCIPPVYKKEVSDSGKWFNDLINKQTTLERHGKRISN